MNQPTGAVPTEVREQPISIGRYLLHRQIARGGMATVHIARLMGDEGFSRIVTAKRLHPQFATDGEFVAMFLDEARIASKVHHRNVVPVLDVVSMGDELVLVQEHVHGAPLSWLLKEAHDAKAPVPIPVAVSIACQVLAGLHAAHETTDEMGVPLEIVHRDVSPQNIMVATDGTARLLDFGVAKAVDAAVVTRKGLFKGKLAYAAPEHLRGRATQQSDIYSLAVVLWEALVGQRMFPPKMTDTQRIAAVMQGNLPAITEALADQKAYMAPYRWKQIEALDPIVAKGLSADAKKRWATAQQMEEALAHAVPPAPASDVVAWLTALGKEFIEKRDQVIAAEEARWRQRPPSENAKISARAAIDRPTVMGSRFGGRFTELFALRRQRTWLAAATGVILAALVFVIVMLRHKPMRDEPATAVVVPVPVGAVTARAPREAVRGGQALEAPRGTAAAGLVDAMGPAVPVMPSIGMPPAEPPHDPEASPRDALAPPHDATVSAHEIREPTVPVRDASSPARTVQRTQPAPRIMRAVRAPQQRAATPPPKQPQVAPAPPPPPAPDPAPATKKAVNCNPPYYFEGSKKKFKPACL